jgi:flavocytochrome c
MVSLLQASAESKAAPTPGPDVLVVGSGMAGLSAALESARSGAKVLVIDMASVFGGHAVMSGADVAIVDTPLQHARNVKDSADLAYEDFIHWGEDNNREWVRYYVEHSREDIYDWLTALGVTFDGLRPYPGNSVPRAHMTQGLGLGLVGPVYRACLENPNIRFQWNMEVVRLILKDGHIAGVRARSTRSGEIKVYDARAVVLATGGFQSNLALVRQNWPKTTPIPAQLLAGSGINSMGSGLRLAKQVGGALSNLDHQWNYQRGLPDPRYPGSGRGLNAGVARSIWINAQGNRFVNEDASSPETLRALLEQPQSTYWSIFDEHGKASLFVVGTGWNQESIEHWILQNPTLLKRADSIEDLAKLIGVPAKSLATTISNYNAMASRGDDADFGRFHKVPLSSNSSADLPFTIGEPPFYALDFFPMTRKSMGGVTIDRFSRVVDDANRPIAGLYAAGEAAGLAGINGKAALEGTFLGPSILTGRVAGRTAVSDLGIKMATSTTVLSSITPTNATSGTSTSRSALTPTTNQDCLRCHNLKASVAMQRPGYWHFERAHQIVLEQQLQCTTCHSGMSNMFDEKQHKIDRLAQSQICSICHNSQ